MSCDIWVEGDAFKINEPMSVVVQEDSMAFHRMAEGTVGTVLNVLKRIDYLVVTITELGGTTLLRYDQIEKLSKIKPC